MPVEGPESPVDAKIASRRVLSYPQNEVSDSMWYDAGPGAGRFRVPMQGAPPEDDPTESYWVLVGDKVAFGPQNRLDDLAWKLAQDAGLSNHTQLRIRHRMMMGQLEDSVNMAYGEMKGGYPVIHGSNVDRNWVYDRVMERQQHRTSASIDPPHWQMAEEWRNWGDSLGSFIHVPETGKTFFGQDHPELWWHDVPVHLGVATPEQMAKLRENYWGGDPDMNWTAQRTQRRMMEDNKHRVVPGFIGEAGTPMFWSDTQSHGTEKLEPEVREQIRRKVRRDYMHARGRTAGLTRNQKQRYIDHYDQLLGPDQSEIVHEFPNGWSIRKVQDYADLFREGCMLGNCLKGKADWIERDPESRREPLMGNYRHSVRDEMNYPVMHFNYHEPVQLSNGETAQARITNALGHANSIGKPAYHAFVEEWADTLPHPVQWQVGTQRWRQHNQMLHKLKRHVDVQNENPVTHGGQRIAADIDDIPEGWYPEWEGPDVTDTTYADMREIATKLFGVGRRYREVKDRLTAEAQERLGLEHEDALLAAQKIIEMVTEVEWQGPESMTLIEDWSQPTGELWPDTLPWSEEEQQYYRTAKASPLSWRQDMARAVNMVGQQVARDRAKQETEASGGVHPWWAERQQQYPGHTREHDDWFNDVFQGHPHADDPDDITTWRNPYEHWVDPNEANLDDPNALDTQQQMEVDRLNSQFNQPEKPTIVDRAQSLTDILRSMPWANVPQNVQVAIYDAWWDAVGSNSQRAIERLMQAGLTEEDAYYILGEIINFSQESKWTASTKSAYRAGYAKMSAMLENPVSYQFVPLTEQELAMARQSGQFTPRAHGLNLRAKRRGDPGRVKAEELQALWNRYEGRCAYCGASGADTFDHVKPFMSGGSNTIDNLLPAHEGCNQAMNKWDTDLNQSMYPFERTWRPEYESMQREVTTGVTRLSQVEPEFRLVGPIEMGADDYEPGGEGYRLEAYLNGKYVGDIRFSVQEGSSPSWAWAPAEGAHLWIVWMHTEPEWRRQGVASALMEELKRRYPGYDIASGGFTDEGAEWWDARMG